MFFTKLIFFNYKIQNKNDVQGVVSIQAQEYP